MSVICNRLWKPFCQRWCPEIAGTLWQCRVPAASLAWLGLAIMARVRLPLLGSTRRSRWSYMHWTRLAFIWHLFVHFLSTPACLQASKRGILFLLLVNAVLLIVLCHIQIKTDGELLPFFKVRFPDERGQHQIYKCGDHVWYRCWARVLALTVFHFLLFSDALLWASSKILCECGGWKLWTLLNPVLNLGWRCGVVASVVRRMNEVTLRWARLVLGWVTIFWRVYRHGT